jgi:hypothetical protein
LDEDSVPSIFIELMDKKKTEEASGNNFDNYKKVLKI